MAATLTREGDVDKLFVSFPITKFETTDDGNLMVYGKATDETVDSDEQIVKGDWSGPALQSWLKTGGNLRVQHNPSLYPAGKGLTVEETPDGHFVKALVVEPTAMKLVKAGVLQAYSVGISRPVIERDITGKARGGIIKGGEIFELSLVDRPANKNCSITLSKSAAAVTKSEDGTVTEQWTYGDLEGQLAQSAIAKMSGPELAREWLTKRQEWLDAEPDPASATQGPEYMAKRFEWNRWHSDGQHNGLTDDGYDTWVTKRRMDPNVGGGVDRDKIPAADFAGKDRSFPIVTPGDVSDAASSIGRAGDDNFSADQLKANIIRIAKRKGPEFVAALPKSWTDESGKIAKAGKKKKPSFMIGVNEGGSKTDEIPVAHKDGSCSVCGEPMANGMCSCCNASPCTCDPKAAKADDGEAFGGEKAPPFGSKPEATKKKKGKKSNFMGGEGSDASLGEGGTTKAMSKCACPNGHECDEGDAFCSQCGTAVSSGGGGEVGSGGSGSMTDSSKSLMPTRAKGKKNKKISPAGAHREPDGNTTVEQLEGDAGMSTTPDSKPDRVPASVDATGSKKPLKKAGDPVEGSDQRLASYSVKRAHDAVCAAYHADDVFAEYPSLKSINDALSQISLPLDLAQDALTMKSADPAMMADARAELHKMFMDSYPSVRIKPGSPPKPGQFQRPYLSAGRPPMTGNSKKKNIPASSRTVKPGDFHRASLTAGHEADSPANKGGNNPISSVASGSSHDLYSAASREFVVNTMKALHDHIEMTRTGMCPMSDNPSQMPPDNRASATLVSRSPLNTAVGAIASTKGFDAEQLGAVVDKLVGKKTKKVIKSLQKSHETQLAAIRAELDELGRKPDPTQAPVRGVVRKAAGGIAPVERRNLALEAQVKAAKAEKIEYVTYLQNLAKSGDPETREKAYKALATEGVSDPYSVGY